MLKIKKSMGLFSLKHKKTTADFFFAPNMKEEGKSIKSTFEGKIVSIMMEK